MFRRIITIIITLSLMASAAACSSGQNDNIQNNEPLSSAAPSSEQEPNNEPSATSDGMASTVETDHEQQDVSLRDAVRNSAVDKINSLVRMPEEATGAIQWYGTQMGWMEANQIANLERYTPITDGEYFLIVPQYINSTVLVESLDWKVADSPTVKEVTYHKENTPDDYALVMDTTLPEDVPLLRVTISHGNLTGSYSFLYDGRGEPLTMMDNGIYRTEYNGFIKSDTSNPDSASVPNLADKPGFQSGAGTHDRSGVFFVENDPADPNQAKRVDYAVKLPYEWTKEFKYPDSEYAQYFFSGEYLVRFEGYYWDGLSLTEHLSYPDAAEIITLGTKTVYVEHLRSGDTVFNEYFFIVEDTDFYVKAVLYPYLHSPDDPTLTYTHTLNELDEEVRLMIASFYVTEQTITQRPF